MTRTPSLLTLILLTGYAAFSGLLYTPALPQIAHDFHITANQAHMSMTVFILGYMIGQFFYGPITQRLGRKPTLYIGIGISLLSCMICLLGAYSLSFAIFLVGLFLLALGTSSGLVIAFAMINDTYQDIQARKMISYATLAFATMPGIGAFTGGFLVKYFGWSSCFVFLMFFSMLLLWLCAKLPETATSTDPDALQIKAIFKRYRAQLGNRDLVRYAITWGLSTAMIYIFATASPGIVMNQLKYSPAVFGLVNLTTSTGLLFGNLMAANLANRLSARYCIGLGIIIAAIGIVGLGLVSLLGQLTLVSFYVPVFILYFGLPMVFTNASALAAKDATDKPTASSLITLINLSITVLALMLTNIFVPEMSHEIPEVFAGILLVMLLMFKLTESKLVEP